MTREEAIELLDDVIGAIEDNQGRDYDTAFRMAIEALTQDSMQDLISRQDAIKATCNAVCEYDVSHYPNCDQIKYCDEIQALISLPSAGRLTEWIPVSERLPEHSYTKKFWLTVKLNDDEGTVATLIGTWGAWCGGKSNKSYDAFDCWKDVMINGGIYRMSQPIPKEQVLAWMPLPEPYREDSEA